MTSLSVNNKYSRYSQGGTSFITKDKKIKWWTPFDYKHSNDDLIIEILPRFHKRPDRIAFELYGKSELSWLILQYNTILDINEEFISGKFIRAPHPDRVLFDILNKPLGGIEK